MALIWKMEKAFMKDIIEAYSNPKPAPTSIATLLKRLYNKKFIDNKVYGNSREYFPLVDKENYLNIEITKLINLFYNGSVKDFKVNKFIGKIHITEYIKALAVSTAANQCDNIELQWLHFL